jgi:hypothetical protein
MLTNIASREVSHVKEGPFLIAAVFLLTVYWFVLRGARTKQSGEKMLLRARIAAARGWFARQLRKPEPTLRDEWTPYLLALGLGRNVDRWFASFGAVSAFAASSAAARSSPSATSHPSMSASSSAGPSVNTWSGGGGAFGGAGATGSWALAATSLGSGSSAPMQVSSGGSSGGGSSSGSSGGSSSSGGGGGGGW